MLGNYILHDKLGQGGFGCVMKGVHSETGEFAAIKFVPKSSFKQISDLQRVYQEIQALRNLHHPNVVRIIDVADHPDNVCFIMEFAPGGELRAYVERHCFLSEEEARQFFKQIVRAIHYVHSKKIIHRDLKLENILLDAQNRCKIVDFGLSDYVSSQERTVTDAGTEAYLAPEVYSGSSAAADPYKIDVWGMGVILYALAHGKLPFSRPDVETCARLQADGGPHFNEGLSEGYRRVVSAMLTPSPSKRTSVDEISLDPWVTQHRFAQCEGGLVPLDSDEDARGADMEEQASSSRPSSSAPRATSSTSGRGGASDGRRSATGGGSGAQAAATGGSAVAGRTPARGVRPGRTGDSLGSTLPVPAPAPGAARRRGPSLGPPSPSPPSRSFQGPRERQQRTSARTGTISGAPATTGRQ